MKIQTSELIGPALDWVVAKCEGYKDKDFCSDDKYFRDEDDIWYSPSTDWAQGGPIIEREGITVVCWTLRPVVDWMARLWLEPNGRESKPFHGETPLIAAMRVYVASKLGDEVEIPEELT